MMPAPAYEPSATEGRACPGCGSADLRVFYEQRRVPAHSMILCEARDEAVSFPRGDIVLAHCAECDFVSNLAFDATLGDYGPTYESSQASSGTFNRFQQSMVADLVERHHLRGKTVLEIGCGQGEFLLALCETGGNEGVGLDPAYVGPPSVAAGDGRATFVAELLSSELPTSSVDFVCCKMTLEHISRPAEFVATIRRSLGERRDVPVFMQVPEAVRIFRGAAFWDVYYEHCSYFSPAALASLFQREGFEVTRVERVYDGQYLVVEALPSGAACRRPAADGHGMGSRPHVETFAGRTGELVDGWKRRLREAAARSHRVIVWGGGSKAVAFLSAVDAGGAIGYVVDVNPRKWRTYLPSSGHLVAPPEAVRSDPPDLVVVMNPIYVEEIRRQLRGLGADPTILALAESPDDG